VPNLQELAEYIWDVKVQKIKLPAFKDKFITEVIECVGQFFAAPAQKEE
jgi:hypothetical protein